MFLTDSEKLECEAALNVAFETFMEPIYIYQAPTQTIVTTDSNYNWAFGVDQPSVTVENVTNSGVFYASIEYLNNESLQRLDLPVFNEAILAKNGLVRLSISGAEGYNYLKSAEKLVFDGRNYKIFSDLQPRGLFTRQNFTDCYLTKTD